MATIHRAPGDAELLASNLIPIIIYLSLELCLHLKTIIEIANGKKEYLHLQESNFF